MRKLKLNRYFAYYRQLSLLFMLTAILLVSCGKQETKQPREKILAQIGDKSISVNEFIRRAEYTVRPPYCRGSHNLDKKIVINSLIAEKLMATEAGDANSFIMNDKVQAYLRGRKEQAMRQWLFQKEAKDKVVLDSAKVWNTVRVAGRKYKISYLNVPDSAFAYEINNEIRDNNRSLEDVFFETTGLDTIPKKEVEWSVHEHDAILDSLYSRKLKKDQVVGPVKTGKNEYMMIQIKGWIDRVAITENQIQERWSNVSDEYIQRQAVQLYDNFILDVMKGKTIDFMPDVFFKVSDLLGPVYIQTEKEKEAMLNKSFWDKDDDIEKTQDVQAQMKTLYQEPFFKVDDEIWTVKDFVDELAAHPLVFRKTKMKNEEFGQQLQFAIMDMIRDKYLSQIAYDRGYDEINVIQRNVNMWKDNLNYQYYKEKFLKGVLPDTVTEMAYIPLIENYLNPMVDSLQIKYSDYIQVDVEAFNDIKLTRIDMSVTQKNVPFAKVVPSFPIITTDNRLDYGSKMENPPESEE